MRNFLELEECKKYYYDAAKAERKILAIEDNLPHVDSDELFGQPIKLLPYQKQIISDVYGWRKRSDGSRRFQKVFIESAKGMGKTPFLAAWGIADFLDADKSNQIAYSIASEFEQAQGTFRSAKRMILESKRLREKLIDSGRVGIHQYEITFPERNSRWSIVSGKDKGKQGPRPSFILFDELHEASRRLYESVNAGFFKRKDALMVIATNAGWDTTSICYELHTKAVEMLEGKTAITDEAFYPVIFAAHKDDDPTLEATWRKANPCIGVTIPLENVAQAQKEMRENDFRRFYCTQWTAAAERFFDLDAWDKCTKPHGVDLTTLPLYISGDFAKSDDLVALTFMWVDGDKCYVKVKCYIPRATAKKYEDEKDIPYFDWAEGYSRDTETPKSKNGFITILDSDLVADAAYKKFEKLILKMKEKYNLRLFAYDRRYATPLVARLERHGIACVPVDQKPWVMGPATEKLETMVNHGLIYLPRNDCLRWQAENASVKTFKDNIMLVKEGANPQYAGRRWLKIDAIVSMVIALSQAMRHEFLQLTGDKYSQPTAWDCRIAMV